jgi:hypothetical protein
MNGGMRLRRMLALAALLAGCASQREPRTQAALVMPWQEPADWPRLAAREDLPVALQQEVALRMARHRDRMGALTFAVLLLDYGRALALAEELAREPSLARQSPALRASLPIAFFRYERELKEAARGLAASSMSHDDEAMGLSFDQLASACLNCHAVYLHEPLRGPNAPSVEPPVGPISAPTGTR